MNGNYKGNDEIGHLVSDFKQKNPNNIFYKELADGVKHFKESEEGQETMCDLVEKYADMKAEKAAEEAKIAAEKAAEEAKIATEKATESATKSTKIDNVKKLMQNLNLNLDEALNALGICGDEREYIVNELGK